MELTCPYCGFSKQVPQEKIPPGVTGATCPRCQQWFPLSTMAEKAPPRSTGVQRQINQGTHQEEEQNETVREKSAWERRNELGLWSAIYQNTLAVLFSPARYFRKLSIQGGVSEPLAFGLLTGSVGSMFSLFWQFLMVSGVWHFMADVLSAQVSAGMVFLILVIFVPIGVTIGLFVSTAVWHLLLLLLRGAGNGFEATFRLVSYSQAAQLWGVIPFVGSWISIVWQLVIQVIGLKQIHETSYPKVIAAFLIPLVVMGLLVIGLIVLIFAAIGRQQLGYPWF